MIYLPGLLCILIFTFYIGTIFANRFKLSLSQFVLLSIIVSLWFSWIVVFFLNKFDLSFSKYFIYILFIFIFFTNLFKSNKKKISEIFIFLFFFILLAFILFFFLIRDTEYLPVFTHGDAVFQWNGLWAFNLFNNQYKPYGNYPVFWPGIWSLIYKSLGGVSNWILPSLSLFILPIISIISLHFFLEKKKFIILLSTVLFLIIFSLSLSNRYFIGYMDVPLAILSFTFFSIILSFYISFDVKYLIILSFLTGIISITKQAGFIFVFFYFLILVENYFTGKINLKLFFLLNFIAILPFLLFLHMDENANLFTFIFKTIFGSYGNQTYLKSLSIAHTANENLYIYSYKKLFERFNIYIFNIFILVSLLNFFNIKKKISLIGSLIFVIATISFYYYANYGSYDDRNGWFILPMLFFSFLCFIESLNINVNFKFALQINRKIKNYSLEINKLLFCILVLISFSFVYIEKKINFDYVQKVIQSNFGGLYFEGLYASDFLNKNKGCSKIITNLHIFAYNYYVFPYYNLDKLKSRVIVLSSDTDISHFIKENSSCKEIDLFVFNKPIPKNNSLKFRRPEVFTNKDNLLIFDRNE